MIAMSDNRGRGVHNEHVGGWWVCSRHKDGQHTAPDRLPQSIMCCQVVADKRQLRLQHATECGIVTPLLRCRWQSINFACSVLPPLRGCLTVGSCTPSGILLFMYVC